MIEPPSSKMIAIVAAISSVIIFVMFAVWFVPGQIEKNKNLTYNKLYVWSGFLSIMLGTLFAFISTAAVTIAVSKSDHAESES